VDDRTAQLVAMGSWPTSFIILTIATGALGSVDQPFAGQRGVAACPYLVRRSDFGSNEKRLRLGSGMMRQPDRKSAPDFVVETALDRSKSCVHARAPAATEKNSEGDNDGFAS
jgi:hypothetical protein